MKNKLLLGIIMVVLAASAVRAAHLETAATKLDDTISGGGSNTLQSPDGSIKLQDLKGQEAIGVLGSGPILYIGGLYALTGGGGGKGEGEDNAYIKNIYLYKEGANIKVKWTYTYPALTSGAVIYRLVGGDFSKDNTKWSLVPGADVDSTVTSFDLGADDGAAAYYMVAPKIAGAALAKDKMFDTNPAVPGDYLGKDANKTPYISWPVAKIAATFAAGESKLVGYPFRPTGPAGFLTRIADIATQAGLTDGALWYNSNDAKGLLKVLCAGGNWEINIDVGLASGYWLMSDAARTYTFTGALISQEYDKNMVLGSDLYSYAFPLGINSATLKIDKGYELNDAIWIDQGGLVKYSYINPANGINGWDGSFAVPSARGFWYQKVSAEAKFQTIP